LVFEFIIFSNEFVGKKPPEEIIVIAKLNESKKRISKKLSIIKIKKVRILYKINILTDWLNVSEVLNDK